MNAPAAKSGFVDVLALVSLALGALGVASSLLQFAATPTLDAMLALQFRQFGATLPADVQWMLAHVNLLNGISLLASALSAWVSWGLWKRREWGRIGFILLLFAGTAACIAGAAWCLRLFDAMLRIDAGDAADFAGQTLRLLHVATWTGTAIIVLLHAGIAWKLCTRAIRAEFA